MSWNDRSTLSLNAAAQRCRVLTGWREPSHVRAALLSPRPVPGSILDPPYYLGETRGLFFTAPCAADLRPRGSLIGVVGRDTGAAAKNTEGVDDLYTKLKTLQRQLEFCDIQVHCPSVKLGDAKSSLGDAESSLGDARARWVTVRARLVTLRAHWVTLRALAG
jgi:hypothetical protein